MLQDFETYIQGNFTLWNGNEEGENLFIWLKRKEPVLFNLLIIQQKYSYCFTKIYQKMQQIILHSYISFYIFYLFLMPDYQKVDLKLLPHCLNSIFLMGSKTIATLLGNCMILAETTYINSIFIVSWYNSVIHLPVGPCFLVYMLEFPLLFNHQKSSEC